MKTRKKKRVQIGYRAETFDCDEKPITFEEALGHWNRVGSADYTIAAFKEIVKRITKP